MIDKYNDNDGLSDYIIINEQRRYISEEESNLIDEGYEYIDGEFIYTENTKIRQRELIIARIQKVHDDFDSAISEYLSQYPKREQDTFAEKKREAEKVVNGGESVYIDNKAQALGISSLQFANIIIAKNNEWTLKYIELENAKDMEVMQLEQKLAELDF